MPRAIGATIEPRLALRALAMVKSGDLDAAPLRDLARFLDASGDPSFPLHLGRAHLLGLLDAAPGDHDLTLAIGLLAAAGGKWSGHDDRRNDDARVATRRRRAAAR